MSFFDKVFRYENDAGDSIIFSFDNGFVINKPTGIDSVTVSVATASGIDQVGATVQSAVVQPRPITVNGRLVGEWQNENKERLLSVIRPDLFAKLYAEDYFLIVRPTETPTIEPRPQFAAFQFTLLAAYPYWQHEKQNSATLTGVSARFKFPWNVSRAYQFGERINTQFVNVQNRGQLPVPFVVTFIANGACANPKITNVTTGEFLALRKTMQDGERVIVSISHDKTDVTSSIDGDIRGTLSLDSNLFRLRPGDNVLKPEAESGLDGLETVIDHFVEKVGVALWR